MKTKIMESNKYKRYNLYLVQFGGIYGAATFIFLTYAIVASFSEESVARIWITIGVVIAIFSVGFLPWIFYYGIKMLLMKKNSDSYINYIGVITSIQTSEMLRTDHRMVDIKVDGVKEIFRAKVYKGKLYDEVARNTKVEFAYNEKNSDIVVLGVL
jgi:glucan phosphoethanolaminetransferase (alkaline phosphatase superfamily)